MSQIEKIKAVIYAVIDEFNLSQELENRLDKNENEVLFSRVGFTEAGKLDSLSLVYFLVTLEEYLQSQFGGDIDLKTQELIESKEKNLKNISSLILYIQSTI